LAFEKDVFRSVGVGRIRFGFEDDVVTLGVFFDLVKPEIGDVFLGSDDEDVIEEDEDATTTVQGNPGEQFVAEFKVVERKICFLREVAFVLLFQTVVARLRTKLHVRA
jgi:hypothetical protein